MIRAAAALTTYLSGVWALLFVFCFWPGRALALVSPQAYARVVAQAEWIAYQAATKPSVVSAVASAASASSPTSIAIRAVAGPVGWAALGVTVGLALYQTYYSDTKLNQIKANTETPGAWTIPSYTPPAGHSLNVAVSGGTRIATIGDTFDSNTGSCKPPGPGTIPSGWTGPTCFNLPGVAQGWGMSQPSTSTTNAPTQSAPTPATPTQIENYVNNLPSADPLSVPSNSAPLGQNGPAPTSASQVQTVPVSPAEMPTTVKPSSQVSATDIKVADNVPPPAGAPQNNTTTQTSTTTTTTTTNPDGSTTESKTTTAPVNCSAASPHDQRTMGTILYSHMQTWNGSGILGAVNLLKNLTWPTTLPVLTLTTHQFGTFHMDFNDWSWFFVALRALVIAGATLAAYRIVFVGAG